MRHMKKPTGSLTPKLARRAKDLGERLRLARLRRRLASELAATRARASRSTLSRLENGDPSVSFATVLRLLSIYGLDADIDKLAADDELGRNLRDAQLTTRRVGRRRASVSESSDD